MDTLLVMMAHDGVWQDEVPVAHAVIGNQAMCCTACLHFKSSASTLLQICHGWTYTSGGACGLI